MRKIKLAVPAGIGDFSWIWVKLSTIKDVEWEVYSPDCYPQRTKEFCDLLENVQGGLGKHTYQDILLQERRFHPLRTWQDYQNAFGEDIIYIQSNKHLEQGKPLRDWLPDLDCNFHYKLNLKEQVMQELKINGPLFGFHTASMQGIRNWNAWMPETWVEFLKQVYKEFPDFTFIALGGYWDVDTIQEIKGLLKDDFPLIDLVGKTTISDAIRILNKLDYYVGFSSGLNCLANVLNKPCTALWPKHQRQLMYSWADPESVVRRDYMGFTYDSPERIFNRIKTKIKEILYTRKVEAVIV